MAINCEREALRPGRHLIGTVHSEPRYERKFAESNLLLGAEWVRKFAEQREPAASSPTKQPIRDIFGPPRLEQDFAAEHNAKRPAKQIWVFEPNAGDADARNARLRLGVVKLESLVR